MIEIRRITEEHQQDIRLPNEAFPIYGRLIPRYENDRWSYTTERFDEVSEDCFPDENYDFAALSVNSVFLGAYDGETCVGLAIMQQGMFQYMYLYDLKVNRACRRQGVGALLMQAAMTLAHEQGYRGIYTQAQDNNLAACLFYLKTGFHIGGLDTDVYKGTAQEGKRDVLMYWDEGEG